MSRAVITSARLTPVFRSEFRPTTGYGAMLASCPDLAKLRFVSSSCPAPLRPRARSVRARCPHWRAVRRPGDVPAFASFSRATPSIFVLYHRHRTARERIRHVYQARAWVAIEKARTGTHLDGRHYGPCTAVVHGDRARRRVAAPTVGDVDPAVVGIEQHAMWTTAHRDGLHQSVGSGVNDGQLIRGSSGHVQELSI